MIVQVIETALDDPTSVIPEPPEGHEFSQWTRLDANSIEVQFRPAAEPAMGVEEAE